MFELLHRVGTVDPSRTAILTFEGSTSYADLVSAAEHVAEELRTQKTPRFAIVDHDAAVIAALLAGAELAGVEACQYPPAKPEEISELIERFDHEVLVTDRSDLLDVAPVVLFTDDLLDPGRTQKSTSPTEAEAVADTVGGGRTKKIDAERPHLVLTTGTTGAPRGVRHDWSRLMRGIVHTKSGAGERWLLAYGLHQFAGLQIMLHVFAAGATLVAPAPRRPREGLSAMRELGVTHASATPTYWRFLLAELRSDGGDVPELTQITMGGEAIPGPLLGEIERTFPRAKVSQIYAASEFGSTSSMRDGRAGLSVDVLDRSDDADVAFKIVDDELWIRSRTGMLGYYAEPPVDADGWRATGDLVEVDADRIMFRGRSSEIINVGGVKVHPLPIEERVCAVPGVDVARVFGRPNPMTGAIVALEVVATEDTDRDTTKAAIRQACSDLPPASQPRSIRFVDSLTTVGGKIIRRPQ